MKLPRVSIEYVDEKSFALGKMSLPLIIGFGSHWAWIYLAMFNGGSLFYPESAELRIPVIIASLIVFSATLFGYAFFIDRVRSLFVTSVQRKRNRLIGAICTSTGTLLLSCAGYFGMAAIALSGLLTGFGSAVLLMSYGVSFGTCDIAVATTSTALSLLVGTVIYVVTTLIGSLDGIIAPIVCVALPLVECVCLNLASTKLIDKLEFVTMSLPVNAPRFAWHAIVPSLLFGLLIGSLRDRAVYSVQPADSLPFSALAPSIALAAAIVCVLLICAMLFQRQSDNFLFRTMMPVVAFCLLLTCIPHADTSPFAVCVLFTCYLLLEGVLWIMYADMAQRFRISAFLVFGFGRGALALGTLIGYLAANELAALSSIFAALPEAEALICLFVLVLARNLLPTNAEMRATLKHGQNCPAFITDDSFDLNLLEPIEAGTTTQRTPIAHGDRETARAATQTQTLSVEEAPQSEEPHDTTQQERKPHAPDRNTNKHHIPGRFKRKCAIVAETYLLSHKETEVLFLLAKGRNAAAIQENLYISAGTVNTHMRHIYRKLNVHSQQELMDLVDAVDLSDYEDIP